VEAPLGLAVLMVTDMYPSPVLIGFQSIDALQTIECVTIEDHVVWGLQIKIWLGWVTDEYP